MNIANESMITSDELASLVYDDRGLIPVIAQQATTGEVLMLAWANAEALQKTLDTSEAWFFSRSRGRLWRKGETSGSTMRVVDLHADCDRDTVLARVEPAGPACHTGARNCFGTSPTLTALAERIAERAAGGDATGSYTRRLLADPNLRLKKLGEEATELALACQAGERARIAEEAADMVYHALVAAYGSGVTIEDALGALERRLNRASGGGEPGSAGR